MTIAELIGELRPRSDRPILDRTELRGIYQFKTLLPPPQLSPAMQQILGNRDIPPSGVSLSRSVEQLGLKLEPKDTPVDFVVIDSIDRPSEN
jgi:uncharacterized protein (TIGR03435 family)